MFPARDVTSTWNDPYDVLPFVIPPAPPTPLRWIVAEVRSYGWQLLQLAEGGGYAMVDSPSGGIVRGDRVEVVRMFTDREEAVRFLTQCRALKLRA